MDNEIHVEKFSCINCTDILDFEATKFKLNVWTWFYHLFNFLTFALIKKKNLYSLLDALKHKIDTVLGANTETYLHKNVTRLRWKKITFGETKL